MVLLIIGYILKGAVGLLAVYIIVRICEDIDFAQPKVIVCQDDDGEDEDKDKDKEDEDIVEMPTKTHIYVISKSTWHRLKRWLLNTLSGTISFFGILLAIYLFMKILNIHLF